MNLTISCPQCGYNEYKALNTKTNKEVTIIISKCETTACELQIPEDEIDNTFERRKIYVFQVIILYLSRPCRIVWMMILSKLI